MKKWIKRVGLSCLILFLCTICICIVIPHYSSKDGLCILGYHGVVSDEEKSTLYKKDRYTLSVSQFEKQMKYLYERGYTTYFMEDVENYMTTDIEPNEKAVVLTFDDGLKNFNTIVKPILEKYHFKGTCFVIGKHVEDDNNKYLKEEDMINDEYVEYYSHSNNLHRLSKKGINRKIIQDLTLKEIQEDFEKNCVDSTYFAFPYGRSRKDITPVLKENGVRLAFTYNTFKHAQKKDDIYYIPRYMIVDIFPFQYFKWIVN